MLELHPDSRAVALRFLQTVIVVDDHAYLRAEEVDVPEASLGGESLDGLSLEGGPGWDPVEPLLDDDEPPVSMQEFDTEVIVRGFADLGMACTALAPSISSQEADIERTVSLARRCDVVVLDWLLFPAGGVESSNSGDRTSREFIARILESDREGGGRTRLICIYTGEADGDAIFSLLCDRFPDGHTEGGGSDRRLDIGSSRLVVLGKGREFDVPTIESVDSDKLPERIVLEFGRFVCTGLLREIALESLSEVRDQSHRLLRRFVGDLDPALLSHRSATSPAAADQFVKQLIGSELSAIVAAGDVARSLSDARIEAIVSAALDGRVDALYWSSARSAGTKTLSPAQVIDVVVNGSSAKRAKLPSAASRSSLFFDGDAKQVKALGTSIDHRFSMLSSLDRDAAFEPSGAQAPTLQLGSLLRSRVPFIEAAERREEEAGAETSLADRGDVLYWLCLQPLCDSVRLEVATAFPFIPLEESGDSGFDLVVGTDGATVGLRVGSRKLSAMTNLMFEPVGASGAVEAMWSESGASWEFTSSEGRVFSWLGSLRADKAQQLVHSIVTDMSRVGIDEYEYMREAGRG